MNTKEQVFAWLDEHGLGECKDYGEVADLMLADGITGKRATLRRYAKAWADNQGETSPATTEKEEEEAEEERTNPLSALERDYLYREDEDLYILWLPHRPKAQRISGEDVRAMKEAYSNWTGEAATLNEVARTFGIPRRDFMAIKTAMGWTHDSSPYTDEVLASSSTTDLVEDLAKKRERDLEIEDRDREWRRTMGDAQKWRKLQRELASHHHQPLLDYVEARGPREKVYLAGGEPREYLAIPRYSDVHYGKMGLEPGVDWCERTRALELEHTRHTIGVLREFGLPARILLTLGDDFCHIDNPQAGTTRGTPQDIAALPHHILYGAIDLQVEVVDHWRMLGCPVDVRVVLSNHSRWTDMALAKALQVAYRHTDQVTVHLPQKTRSYTTYGKNLIGMAHGDRLNLKDAPLLMANEAREHWSSCPHRLFLTADKHHDRELDTGGVMVCQAPSPSTTDRWHEHEGYTMARPGFVTYALDKERGRVLTLHDPL